MYRNATFRRLVQALHGTTYMFRVDNTGPFTDPCQRAAVFLFRVGSADEVRAIAGYINVSEGSVLHWTLDMQNIVVERLQSQYVRWPGHQEQSDMSSGWEAEELRCGRAPAFSVSFDRLLRIFITDRGPACDGWGGLTRAATVPLSFLNNCCWGKVGYR